MKFIFDPDTLQAIAQHAITQAGDGPVDALLDRVTTDLDSEYPGCIDTGPREWIYNSAGGSMGQMAVLQASLNEYLLFYASPLATGAHSGRYRVDLWDIVLRGEMLTWRHGELDPRLHELGSCHPLPPGQAHGYRLSDGAVLLEYGRGPIASALPFALANTFSSTLDFRSLGQTLRRYTALTVKGLLGR